MKYILFVVALYAAGTPGGEKRVDAMAMHEFDSLATCNAAVQKLHAVQQAEAIVGFNAFCLAK
jgi:hypothetical protein